MVQLINEPTRANNILDILLTNDKEWISDIKHSSSLGSSDHDVLLGNIQIHRPKHQTLSYIDFRNADYNLISVGIKCSYNYFFNSLPIANLWINFDSMVSDLIQAFVPVKKRLLVGDKSFSMKEQNLYSRVKNLYKKFKQTPTSKNKSILMDANKVYRSYIITSHCSRENSLLKPGNRSSLFKYVNKLIRPPFSQMLCIKADKGIISSQKTIANLFASYFNNVSFANASKVIQDISFCEIKYVDMLDTCTIKASILSVNQRSACGSDGIPSLFWSRNVDSLTPLLNFLFNRFINENFVLNEWKLLDVIPLYKNKGSKLDASSYRPISLAPCLLKIFESCLLSLLKPYVIDKLNYN